MKKLLLFAVFVLLTKVASAQTYILTRGLPMAEVAGSGTAITGLTDDNAVGPFNIGFDFSFYGVNYSQFYIGANGLISFGSASTGRTTLPNSSLTNSICFANSDLYCSTGTPTINYFTTGTAPNRKLIVNFKNVAHYYDYDNLTSVQIQLYEGTTGKIELHISNITSDYSRTIGIENSDATSYLTETALNGNSSLSITNEMIRFQSHPVCTNTVTATAATATLCDGGTSLLTATVSPSGSFGYEWFKNNAIISGATASTYTATTTGTYYVRITGTVDNCIKSSGNVVINNTFTPTLNLGTPFYVCNSISVSTFPSGTYTHQWLKDDVLISGQTASSTVPQSAGVYKARVTSGGCSVTTNTPITIQANTLTASNNSPSSCSTLSLYSTPSYTPSRTYSWAGPNSFTSTLEDPNISNATNTNQGTYTVTANFGCGDIKTATTNVTIAANTLAPTSYNTNVCGTAYLYANATYTPSNTYSWAGPNSFTSTVSSPTIAGAVAANAGIYTVTVNFGCGDIKTATTALTITPNTLSPSSYSANVCGTLNFYANASYTASRTYSWAGPNNFTSTAGSPSIVGAVIANTGIYTVTVNFGCGDIKTATTAVTVNPNTLTASSSNPNLCNTAVLYSSASYVPSQTYSWAGPNSFTSTLSNATISNVTAANQGIYTLTVNFGCGDIKTATASVTVRPNNLTASSYGNPTLCGNLNLLSISDYTPSSTYSWVGPNSFTSTMTNPQINSVTVANAGTYTVTKNFGCGDIKTATVSVTIVPNTLTASNSNPTVCSNLQLYSTPSYTPSQTYSWAGPNSFTSTLEDPSINTVTAANVGIYTVTVNFGCGDIKTATTAVTISPNTLSPNYSNANLCNTLSLNSNASYTPSRTYSWAGPNSFTSTLSSPTINTVNNINAGIYTVTVNFGCGDIKTATTNVTISQNYVNSPYASYGTNNICNTLQLYSSASYTPSSTYSWSGPNNFTSTLSSPTINSVTTANAGIYSVTINFGCGDIKIATANITIINNTIDPTFSDNNICNTLTLSSGASYTPFRTYSWSGPNNFASTSSSPTIPNVTAAHNGIYTVTVDFGCGQIKTGFVNVTVKNNTLYPSFSGNNKCNTLNLSAGASYTPSRTYSWSGPNSFASTLSSPTISSVNTINVGVYTVTVNFGCGETKSATVNVTIVPNTLTVSSNNAGKCSTLNLVSNASYTPASTYSWSGPNSFTSTLEDPSINNIASINAGIYTLTVNFGCGETKTATTNVTIGSPVLSASSNASSLNNCPGTSIQLTSYNLSSLSGTYSWTGPNGFTSTLKDPTVVLGANSGIYKVTANFGSCGTSTATTSITIGLPSIAAYNYAETLCASSSVNLDTYMDVSGVQSPTVAAYSWRGPNGFSSTVEDPSIANLTTASTGFYTVTVTLSSGCVGTLTAIAAVNVSQNPDLTTGYSQPSNSLLCEAYPITLRHITNKLGNTVANYTWRGPNGYSSTVANPTIDPLGSSGGVYTLTATFSGGCTGTHTSLLPIYPSKKPNISVSSSRSACLGSSLYLPTVYIGNSNNSNSPNLNYNWVGPNSFSSEQNGAEVANTATAPMAGIYTVTVTDATGGCPLPYVATTNVTLSNCSSGGCSLSAYISGSSSICSGSTVSLNAYSSTYVSGTTYSWAGPNGFTSNTEDPYVYNVTVGGTYTVTAIVPPGGLCAGTYTSTVSVSIIVPSSPTLSLFANSNICEGSYLYFSPSASNGGKLVKYTLTGPNGFVYYSASSYTYSYYFGGNFFLNNPTPSMSGTYTVNATVQGQCNGPITQQSTSVVVSVNTRPAPPTISVSPTTIDLGESVTLNSSSCASGNSLLWSTSATANPLVDMPTSNTAYWAVCRSTSGCSSGSSNIANVTVISCYQNVALVNPTNNYSSGTIIKQARVSNGSITATNLITGTAKATYQAKSITLNPGFKADNGTVFKAEMGGCN